MVGLAALLWITGLTGFGFGGFFGEILDLLGLVGFSRSRRFYGFRAQVHDGRVYESMMFRCKGSGGTVDCYVA